MALCTLLCFVSVNKIIQLLPSSTLKDISIWFIGPFFIFFYIFVFFFSLLPVLPPQLSLWSRYKVCLLCVCLFICVCVCVVCVCVCVCVCVSLERHTVSLHSAFC